MDNSAISKDIQRYIATQRLVWCGMTVAFAGHVLSEILRKMPALYDFHLATSGVVYLGWTVTIFAQFRLIKMLKLAQLRPWRQSPEELRRAYFIVVAAGGVWVGSLLTTALVAALGAGQIAYGAVMHFAFFMASCTLLGGELMLERRSLG